MTGVQTCALPIYVGVSLPARSEERADINPAGGGYAAKVGGYTAGMGEGIPTPAYSGGGPVNLCIEPGGAGCIKPGGNHTESH